MLFLYMTNVLLLYWISNQIEKVDNSSKEDETINISKMIDISEYIPCQLEILYFGSYKKRILVRLFTASESAQESITWSRQVD